MLRARGHLSKGISIHALREEGDRFASMPSSSCWRFLSTPSARRATSEMQGARIESCISIHALREEGDATGVPGAKILRNFYPRPPRGGRRPALPKSCGCFYFYPRPPRGGRPKRPDGRYEIKKFLSTPSARRATDELMGTKKEPAGFLSTPSARRATGCCVHICLCVFDFYPRPPRGGRLPAHRRNAGQGLISIHALREEGDEKRY